MSELLEAASLAHLSVVLGSHTLESLIKLFSEQGRTTFIRSLKEQGVEKLSDRQRLATAIAKAAKDGVAASAPKRGSMSRWVNMELAKELAAFDIDESQLMKELQRLAPIGKSPALPGEAAVDLSRVVRPEARVRLIAFYGSGHTASDLADWQAACPTWLEMRVVELPGHGTRVGEGMWSIGTPRASESSCSDDELSEAVAAERATFVNALVDSLTPLVEVPYCLYGFSSGAFFGHLVARELARRQYLPPFRLFAAGRGAPHCVWAPELIRQYRTGSEAAMELELNRGLAVPTIAQQDALALKEEQEQEQKEKKEQMQKELKQGQQQQGQQAEAGTMGSAGKATDDVRVASKNALWRAPLLTAAVCIGDSPDEGWVEDSPMFGGRDNARRQGKEVVGKMRHMSVASAQWKVPCPLIAIASSTDAVWPLPLVHRWADLVSDPRRFRYHELPKISHFKLLDHSSVRELVVREIAVAARAAALGDGP